MRVLMDAKVNWGDVIATPREMVDRGLARVECVENFRGKRGGVRKATFVVLPDGSGVEVSGYVKPVTVNVDPVRLGLFVQALTGAMVYEYPNWPQGVAGQRATKMGAEIAAKGVKSVAIDTPAMKRARRMLGIHKPTYKALAAWLAPDGAGMTYEDGRALQLTLEAECDEADAALRAASGAERGPMGLTPDHVRATPEWQAANRAYSVAFAKLRDHNKAFIAQHGKRYHADLHAERDARRQAANASLA